METGIMPFLFIVTLEVRKSCSPTKLTAYTSKEYSAPNIKNANKLTRICLLYLTMNPTMPVLVPKMAWSRT